MVKKQRNATFDIAKCLAIYLVVLGHALNEKAGDPAAFVNFFHVPTLFFISGYFAGFTVNKYDAATVVKKKVSALLLPYLCWSAVSFAANTALSVLSGAFSVENALSEATSIFVYGRSVWFLLQQFEMFIIFVAVHEILKRLDALRYMTPVCIGVWLLLFCIGPADFLVFYKFKWLFPFFYAGYWICMNRQKLEKLTQGKAAGVVGGLSMLFPLLVWLCYREDYFMQYARAEYQNTVSVLIGLAYYLIGGIGVIFLLTISKWLTKSPVGNLLAEVGTYSMDIYVIHMFLIKFIPIPMDLTAAAKLTAHSVLALISLAVVFLIWGAAKLLLRRIKLYRICVGIS